MVEHTGGSLDGLKARKKYLQLTHELESLAAKRDEIEKQLSELKPKVKKAQLNVTVDRSLLHELRRVAKAEGVSISFIIEMALHNWFIEHEQTKTEQLKALTKSLHPEPAEEEPDVMTQGIFSMCDPEGEKARRVAEAAARLKKSKSRPPVV